MSEYEYPKLKVLAITNHKGGVAKTTLAKLITEYFVRKGLRVLGVDIDPQTNYSMRFVNMDSETRSPPIHPNFNPDDPDWEDLPTPPPGYWSIAQFFRLGYVEPYDTDFENLKFIPSHKSELTKFLEEVKSNEIEDLVIGHMRNMFSLDYYQDEFDIVVIDTPPQTSALIASAYRAATHILIPTMLDEDSITGMVDMAQLWKKENEFRTDGKLQLVGILPTIYDNQAASERRSMERLESSGGLSEKIIKPVMRRLRAYSNTSATYSNPSSLFDMHDSTAAKKEALQFSEEIYRRIFE